MANKNYKLLKTFDPNLRLVKSLNNGISEKTGIEAFIILLEDIIETIPGECPEDINKGTTISSDYLNGSINSLNAIIIRKKIFFALEENAKDLGILDSDVNIRIEGDEYIVSIMIQPDVSYDKRELKFSLSVR